MTSRLRENGETDTTGGRPRVGLSDYTSQRLAELRARRAELDADFTEYKAKNTTPTTTATTTSSSALSSSDLLESYRARRGLSSMSSTTSSASLANTKQDYSSTNGTTSNGISSSSSLSSTKPALATSKPSASLSDTSKPKVSSSHDPKLSNGHPTTVAATNPTATKPTSGSGSSLSSGASFSKADYGSSRGSHMDQIKSSSVSVARSNSARVAPLTEQDDDECVGFASLPEQVHRKAVKRGFDFTLMVVGETGLGKSTLMSSLFLNSDLYKDRDVCNVQERISKTVDIQNKYMEIEEKGIKLRLTIVDTPGFNDSMDAEQSWRPIEDYINHQFDQYFKDESGLNRKNIKDYRVHCCLYFVSPYGHGLRPIDVQFMRRLHDKVNIVPIIAKADTLTKPEVRRLKQKILDQVDQYKIKIYEFPDCDSDEDEDFKQQDSELKASIPFAVIGSNTVVEVAGKKVRGRLYPWGVVEVDNPQHCDFSKLRMMLISTHMQDLKDVTRDVHYENFRARHIKEQMTKSQRERNKLKRDSSPNFESIIDQDGLLQQKDDEIRRMQEMIMKMQAQLQHGGPSKTNGPVQVGLGNL